VTDAVVNDLTRRLAEARWAPNELPRRATLDPNGAWCAGTPQSEVADLAQYWREEFLPKFRSQHLPRLNRLPQFTSAVQVPPDPLDAALTKLPFAARQWQTLRMHYVHAKSEAVDAIPLLLLHGWPGSIVEFIELIPMLTSGDGGTQAFHVVAPSIPGYGFSEAPKHPGGNAAFMARAADALMRQLGYDKYAAQGGDWGAIICQTLATHHPERCVAIHLNMCVTRQPHDVPGKLRMIATVPFLNFKNRCRLWDTLYFLKHESAYQFIQGTKPETLAIGLHDSPVALLAWMLEKFHTWSDCHRRRSPSGKGALTNAEWTRAVDRDTLLLNVMVYWIGESASSSLRLYYEELEKHPHSNAWFARDSLMASGDFCPVPTGVLCGATEVIQPPREWAELTFNLTHWNEGATKGGHFMALENPQALAADMRHFFHADGNFEDGIGLRTYRGAQRPSLARDYVVLSIMVIATLVFCIVPESVELALTPFEYAVDLIGFVLSNAIDLTWSFMETLPGLQV